MPNTGGRRRGARTSGCGVIHRRIGAHSGAHRRRLVTVPWHPPETLADLELTRTPVERRLYTLEGVGTLRVSGLSSRMAVAEADDTSWQFARRGFWGRRIQATAPTGVVVGEFEPRATRRGGTLDWAGRRLSLRPASRWSERYALADSDLELAVFDGKAGARSKSPSTT